MPKYANINDRPHVPSEEESRVISKKRVKTETYLSGSDSERLEALAKELGLSKSELLRKFTTDGLTKLLEQKIREKKALEVKEKTSRGEQIERAYLRALLLSGDRVGTSSWEAV